IGCDPLRDQEGRKDHKGIVDDTGHRSALRALHTPSTNFCFCHHAQINLSSISAHALLIRVKCDRLRIKQGRRETWFSGILANGGKEWPAWSSGETVLE